MRHQRMLESHKALTTEITGSIDALLMLIFYKKLALDRVAGDIVVHTR